MSLAARCVCLTARYPICSTGAAHPALAAQRWGTLSESCITIGYRSKVGCGVRAMGSKQHLVDCYTASDAFSAMMPVLDGSSHKGQHGKVSVIGGSAAYTGAPYFAAYSAMQVGADYGNVYCTKEAAQAIKSYSPELVVFPVMQEQSEQHARSSTEQDESIRALAQDAVLRASCLVIGPGLSRDTGMLQTARSVLKKAVEKEVPVVMDADGIAVVERSVTEDGSLLRGVSKAVLTPNAPEFWRLCNACGIEHGRVQPHDDSSLVQALTDALNGPVIVAKGRHDTICRPGGQPVLASGMGSPRRCGGQGDILAGVLGTATSWAVAHARSQELPVSECIVEAAVNACMLVRCAQMKAFQVRGRSMVASDIVKCLQTTVEQCWPEPHCD